MKNNSAVGLGNCGQMNFCKKAVVFDCSALCRESIWLILSGMFLE